MRHELPNSIRHALDQIANLKERKRLVAQLFNQGGLVELDENNQLVRRWERGSKITKLPDSHKIIEIEGRNGKGPEQSRREELKLVIKQNAGRSRASFRGFPASEPPMADIFNGLPPVIIDASVLLQQNGPSTLQCQKVVELGIKSRIKICLSSSVIGEWNAVRMRPQHENLWDTISGLYSIALMFHPESRAEIPEDPSDAKYVDLLLKVMEEGGDNAVLVSRDPHITRYTHQRPELINHIMHPIQFLEKRK